MLMPIRLIFFSGRPHPDLHHVRAVPRVPALLRAEPDVCECRTYVPDAQRGDPAGGVRKRIC